MDEVAGESSQADVQIQSKTAALARDHARPQYECPVVGAFTAARDILRSPNVIQAGRGADLIPRDHPEQVSISFLDGDIHKLRRVQIARFFSPQALTERYRTVIDASTEKLLARLRRSGREQLDMLSFELACDVAAEIIGLTESDTRAMSLRLRAGFDTLAARPKGRLALWLYFRKQAFRRQLVYWLDVMPAIRARRKQRRDDVISLCLDEGYSNKAIFTECVTYGSAGMMTTREFIVLAAWQLLENEPLRAQFMSGDERNQFAIFDELLRLDPVVTFLHRRATEDFTGPNGEQFKKGQIYALDLRTANLDEAVVGGCPHGFDVGRARRQHVPGSWLSFGEGPHRCPGWQVALHETRVFLEALLKVPGIRLDVPPTPGWTGTTYELHGAFVACDKA